MGGARTTPEGALWEVVGPEVQSRSKTRDWADKVGVEGALYAHISLLKR